MSLLTLFIVALGIGDDELCADYRDASQRESIRHRGLILVYLDHGCHRSVLAGLSHAKLPLALPPDGYICVFSIQYHTILVSQAILCKRIEKKN